MIEKKKIKIVYMGTPDFSVEPLKTLADEGYDVCAAVSQPDKAKNRGKKILPTPVKQAAEQMGIPVIQPEKIKGNIDFENQIKEIDPDLIIAAAYGKILPPSILNIPKYGCINIHASLLPKYRGAAPVQRCIIEGEEKSGVTLMYMEEGLDTGDMLAFSETETAGKTGDELESELSSIGARLLAEKLPDIIEGKIVPQKQDDSLSSYAPMLRKSEGLINFSLDARKLERLVRGMNSWPGTYTYYNGEMLKIWEALASDDDTGDPPGTVTKCDNDGIRISCGKGTLLVTKLQLPGKKSLSASDFLRGNKLETGIVFSDRQEV